MTGSKPVDRGSIPFASANMNELYGIKENSSILSILFSYAEVSRKIT